MFKGRFTNRNRKTKFPAMERKKVTGAVVKEWKSTVDAVLPRNRKSLMRKLVKAVDEAGTALDPD